MKRRLFYRFMFGFTWVFPMPIAYLIADLFGILWYLIATESCRNVLENLARVFPDKKPAELKRISRRLFRNFGRCLTDLFRLHRMKKDDIVARCNIEDMQPVRDAAEAGKGLIIATGHFCNWELEAALLTSITGDLHSVALPDSDPVVDRFYNRARNAIDNNTILLDDAAKACLRLLRDGKALAILADRSYTGEGQLLDFFGRPALFPTGIAQFAVKFDVPVIPYFVRRTGVGRFTTMTAPAIKAPPEGTKQEKIEAVLRAYIRHLEKVIREYPEFWFCFYPVWTEQTEVGG